MLPCKDSEADTGKNDFDLISAPLISINLMPWCRPGILKNSAPTGHLDVGQRIVIEARDTVTSAPEIVD